MDFHPRKRWPGWFGDRTDRFRLDRVTVPATAFAYWMAVGLPVVYLSLLVSGIDGRTELGLFLGLLLVHAVALVGGRNYDPGTG